MMPGYYIDTQLAKIQETVDAIVSGDASRVYPMKEILSMIDIEMEKLNELVRWHIKTLFSTETTPNDTISIETDLHCGGWKDQSYELDVCLINKASKESYRFTVPLYTEVKRRLVLIPYLFTPIDNKDPPPEPLASAIDSVMKGWLPILNAVNLLAQWKHKIKIELIPVKDHCIKVITGFNMKKYPSADMESAAYSMDWTAEYKGATPLQKGGYSMGNYRDRVLHIVSWVKNGDVEFEIQTLTDGFFKDFHLREINLLVSVINNHFSTKSIIREATSNAVNAAIQLAETARKRFSGDIKPTNTGTPPHVDPPAP